MAGAEFTAYLKSSLPVKADGSYDFDKATPVVIGENGATTITSDDKGHAVSIAIPYGKAAATAAGTAVAPGVGTAIGMAAGYAAGVSIEVKDEKMTNRSRKIKFFLDKMKAQENQTDSVAKLVKDLIVRKAITWVKAAAPIIGLVPLLLVLVVAMIAVPVIAVIAKEKIFVSMPSYKTKQVDEQGKPIYQDVCYPVTKDFREKLYNEIISEYEKAKDKSNEKARESAEKHHGNPDKEKDKEATPFR